MSQCIRICVLSRARLVILSKEKTKQRQGSWTKSTLKCYCTFCIFLHLHFNSDQSNSQIQLKNTFKQVLLVDIIASYLSIGPFSSNRTRFFTHDFFFVLSSARNCNTETVTLGKYQHFNMQMLSQTHINNITHQEIIYLRIWVCSFSD